MNRKAEKRIRKWAFQVESRVHSKTQLMRGCDSAENINDRTETDKGENTN